MQPALKHLSVAFCRWWRWWRPSKGLLLLLANTYANTRSPRPCARVRGPCDVRCNVMALLLQRGCTAPAHPGPTAQRGGPKNAVLLRARHRGAQPWLRSQQRPTQSSCRATTSTTGLRDLYPAPRLLQSGLLQVGDGHSVYVEVLGNPNGVPALFVHGGPGAGCYPNHA